MENHLDILNSLDFNQMTQNPVFNPDPANADDWDKNAGSSGSDQGWWLRDTFVRWVHARKGYPIVVFCHS